MSLNKKIKEDLQQTIKDSIRKKFKSYKPETKHMPFHYRLLGKDRMALFSFIHSLNTTFGISIFEPAAEILAKNRYVKSSKQYVLGSKITQKAQYEIQDIINNLTMGNTLPNKEAEIERIRNVATKGKVNNLRTVKADLFVEDSGGGLHLFDLKTVKPNISDFKYFKRTLLDWCAVILYENPDAQINSYIAIPYNPYEPKPYERWTLKGMLDLSNELKVAKEFWDFLGGEDTYSDLLISFEQAGLDIRSEIDEYFKKFNKNEQR